MRTLYIDCSMGAAGDMLGAALLELMPDRGAFLDKLNALGIPGVVFTAEKSVKCGIAGTHLKVTVNGLEEGESHPHHHGSLEDIRNIVNKLPIPTMVKLDVMAVYHEIAQAESAAHGVPVSHVHFHEVGAMDAIADITAVCLMMQQLDADKVVASSVHVGSGTVRCAHGILPVPAPATAHILKGVPIYGGELQGELCTPTGAALLKHFVTEFGPLGPMQVEKIGYGMGKKDFPRANCVRVLLGQTQEMMDTALELCCNIDDMTGEQVGFALEMLMEQGALDVSTQALGMKKSRPGLLLRVLCREQDREKMVKLIFKHTTTLGLRETICSRYVLHRGDQVVETPYGPVRKKTSTGYGVSRGKYEYEDLARIARAQDLSLDQLMENL